MPIFEYRCSNCQKHFERIVFRQSEEVPCPECGSSEAQKLLSSFAVGGNGLKVAAGESGPCHCGAPRRGMCGE